MSADLTVLRWAEVVRQKRDAPKRALKGVAKAVETHLRATSAAGGTPSGEAWQPKKDGGRALENASANIVVESKQVGAAGVVRAVVKGRYALHDLGFARGGVRRQILPDEVNEELSGKIVALLDEALGE